MTIYLDHNATAPMIPQVIEEMARVMRAGGNPSSVHSVGRNAKAILETSRRTIGRMINCRPQKIIFTSGGTEANNIALTATKVNHLIISAAEHDSILSLKENFNNRLDILVLDEKGYVSPDQLRSCLEKAPDNTLVSVMLANNETGVIQNIQQLAEITHQAGALIHTDAIQALGKVPVDFRELGVDMMSLSAHKIGGPQGSGVLIAQEKIEISPLILGGGQEVGRRPGTENLAGIAGFARAVSLVPQNLQKMANVALLRDHIEHEIQLFAPDARIFGSQANRLPNTSVIMMPDVSSETQVMAFDLAGICISAGSACSSGKVKPSHVVLAMGGSREQALSTIRVSLGRDSTEQDIEAFIAVWKKLYDRQRNRKRSGA